MSQEKCQRFQLLHPFTCMVAGMTGLGNNVWLQSLLQQAQTVIDQPWRESSGVIRSGKMPTHNY